MFDLDRFLQAQTRDYPTALREILDGHKQSHWIWYILPQLRGIGHSHNATFYGIDGLDEARAYLAHPVLHRRLLAVLDAMLVHRDRAAVSVLGTVDAAKLRSCATLFHLAAPDEPIFSDILDTFFDGKPCALTVKAVA